MLERDRLRKALAALGHGASGGSGSGAAPPGRGASAPSRGGDPAALTASQDPAAQGTGSEHAGPPPGRDATSHSRGEDAAAGRPAVPCEASAGAHPRASARDALPPLEPIFRGRWVETEGGPAFIKEEVFPPEHRHGAFALGAPLPADGEALAALLRVDRAPHAGRLAYLDLETTGLAGGTGTIAFLVGIGFHDGESFRLRQYFLHDLGGERAMLSLVLEDLSGLDGIVTYNGRSFDLPILEARCTLSRLRFPFARLVHLDLLPVVRRLYKHRLETCRLAEAEREILKIERVDDVPGHLIPSLYFDYIRAGRAAPLRPVLRHNALDVLSMVGILGSAAALFSRPDPDPLDALSLGRWWDLEDRWDRAEPLYRIALEGLKEGSHWSWAARRYAYIRKRAGARREVVGLWQRLWEEGEPWAGVEIAKYLEHEARDIRAAVEVARTLLEQARGADRSEIEHRLARLLRKQGT